MSKCVCAQPSHTASRMKKAPHAFWWLIVLTQINMTKRVDEGVWGVLQRHCVRVPCALESVEEAIDACDQILSLARQRFL